MFLFPDASPHLPWLFWAHVGFSSQLTLHIVDYFVDENNLDLLI